MILFSQKKLIFLTCLFTLTVYQCDKNTPTEKIPVSTTGNIQGRVTSAADTTALADCLITVEPGSFNSNTDQSGYYWIADLSEGLHQVIASIEGFISDSINVTIDAGETYTVNFSLRPEKKCLKWQFIVDKPIYYSTPAVGDDGIIYFGTGVYLRTTSGSLYAIYPDGSLKWKLDFDYNVNTPVIGQDGIIYVMDRNNSLHAIYPDGSLKWKYEDWDINDFVEVGQRVVAIGFDNTLYSYVGACLYAIHPDGTRKWKFDPQRSGSKCGASPVVGKDNTVYAILGDNVLYAVKPDGTLKWELYLENFDEHSYCSPSLDDEDVIYFGTENGDGGYAYAVYPTGIVKWRITVGGLRPVRASPVIGPDGTAYIATKAASHRQPAEILAVSPSGTIQWRYTVESVHFTPDDVYSTPAVGADGLLYFGAETGFIYALNPDGTLNWKYDFHCGLNWSSPTIIEDGTLYIGILLNDGGSLLALETTSFGYANSPWPTFRQNNKNTGRR